jgi:hypothetical protein
MGQFCFMNQHYLIQPFYSSCSLSFSFGVKLPFIMRDAEIFWADSLAPGAGLAKHHMFWPGDFLRCWRRLQGRNARLLWKSSLLNIAVIMQLFHWFFSNHSLLEDLTFRILNSRRLEKALLLFYYNKHLRRLIKVPYCSLGYTDPSPECDLLCPEPGSQEINRPYMTWSRWALEPGVQMELR